MIMKNKKTNIFKKLAVFMGFILSPISLVWADGFSQFTYNNTANIIYPNNYSNSMSVNFQLASNNGFKQLSTNLSEVSSNEDSNQIVKLYQDISLNVPLSSSPIDLTNYADGTVKTINLYVQFLSKTTQHISSSGVFSFIYPIFINDNGTIYNANLRITANVQGSCQFKQSSFSVFNQVIVNNFMKTSTPIGYTCSPGLSAVLTSDNAKYNSNENSNISMSIFSDNSYSNNIAINPVNLISDGTQQQQNLFIQYFENDSPLLKTIGTYKFNSTLFINY